MQKQPVEAFFHRATLTGGLNFILLCSLSLSLFLLLLRLRVSTTQPDLCRDVHQQLSSSYYHSRTIILPFVSNSPFSCHCFNKFDPPQLLRPTWPGPLGLHYTLNPTTTSVMTMVPVAPQLCTLNPFKSSINLGKSVSVKTHKFVLTCTLQAAPLCHVPLLPCNLFRSPINPRCNSSRST